MSDISYPAVARTFERDLVAEPTSLIFIIGAGVLAGMEDTKVTNIVGYLLTFEVQVSATVGYVQSCPSDAHGTVVSVFRKCRIISDCAKHYADFALFVMYFLFLFVLCYMCART